MDRLALPLFSPDSLPITRFRRFFLTICLFTAAQVFSAAEPPALGVKITCPYMPYGGGTSQIIHLTNPSTNAANVVVAAFDDQGRAYNLGVVTSAPANRVTKMATLLNDALSAQGFTSGNVAFEFTITNAAVRAHFSYLVGGSDDGFVASHRELFPLSGQGLSPPALPALGVKITCPYMPYGANAAQIVYLANTSTNAAAINVRAFDDRGDVYNLGQVTTAAGRSVTRLDSLVNNELMAKGFSGGIVTLEVDCDSPEVLGHFSYNIGGTDIRFVATHRELYVLPSANP